MIPTKVGVRQTIDLDTGEVLDERRNSMMMLPPPEHVCQVCAVDHTHDQPHNQQSLHYQMYFHARHGRWPTWTDAMSHCSDPVKKLWRRQLVKHMQANGLTVPEDLLLENPTYTR
jgi:hypothetical protein